MQHETHSAAPEALVERGPVRMPARAPWAARTVLAMLDRLDGGALAVTLPDRRQAICGRGLTVPIDIQQWSVFSTTLRRGDVGFAEAYMRGEWTTPDLGALLTLLARNRPTIERAIHGGVLGGWLLRLRHLLNVNTRRGSRRNVAAHYDLGNDFYRAWLDPSMTYSSALFALGQGGSLEAAQRAKLRSALAQLNPREDARILEIGCGWGSFAEMAARERRCYVLGLSLSTEQLAYAAERIANAGLDDRVELRHLDYRDIVGQFDHVVSIEMYEAVGERYWPDYFGCIARCLKPGGTALIQGITIADELFEHYRLGTDFIQQYIFPGGMLASPSRFADECRRAGLEIVEAFSFGRDYAETLRRWRHAFYQAEAQIVAQGFDRQFLRMWEFYLAYCEAGFESACTDVYQYTLRRT
jgi:cyclopropane-fatty-acyl-phospholipid synthase